MQTIQQIQAALNASAWPCGPVDGLAGPLTYAAMMGYVAQKPAPDPAWGVALDAHLPAAIITVGLPLAHFLGQTAEETWGFTQFVEVGDDAYFAANYDPGTPSGHVLGNTQPGDGALFRGRGLIQITGRWNYGHYAAVTGLDLIGSPDLAAQPDTAARIACAFWAAHGLNALAETDDVEAVTRVVNGGVDGLAARQSYTDRAKALMGL